jgi:BirA family biotin operon repressor/biotin-[acetyl-CoA-carboxylase] ligase
MEFNTLFTGKNYIELQRVDSTNNYAANLMNETNVPDGTVILAHFQENGRGQMGNVWESVAGQNIMTSIVYHFANLDIDSSFLLSKAIALGIYETINAYVKEGVNIKWPNDMLVEGQKISGMLIENKWQGKQCTVIVGIGLNVNQRFFGELDATSLSNCTGLSLGVNEVLNTLLGKIEKHIVRFRKGDVKEIATSYLAHLKHLNDEKEFITATQETFRGKIIDVENSGHLVIQDLEGRLRKFLFKEVFVLS